MTIRSLGEDAYFAASNSEGGFCSYYKECFDSARVGHVYAVKGGPGTGKSRFLRDVAVCAEGNGWKSEYIYCSSDPDSLDGVILSQGERCMALIDATAPHVYEPMHPGVREEIVNLGVFWDAKKLTVHTDAINALNAQKSEAYRRAYRYLCGMGKMIENRDALVKPFVRHNAIRAFAEKMMQGVESEKVHEVRHALMRSVGMRGEVGFDTYFATAEKLYLVQDCRGSAQYLMQELGRIAMEKRLKIRLSHDPVCPDRIDAIHLCSARITVAVCMEELCAYDFKPIRMRRFLETAKMKNVRGEINFAERMSRAMLDGAVEALAAVREAHFRLEALYMQAMDFEAKENFTKSFCDSLFGLQNR